MLMKAGMVIVIIGAIIIAVLTYILFAYNPKTVPADNTLKAFEGPTSQPFVKGPTSNPPK